MTPLDTNRFKSPTNSSNSTGDVKNFVNAVRVQVQNMSDRDIVSEFNEIAKKNTPCKAGNPKQPTIKFLKSIEKEFKEINAHVSGTAKIANEYANLLHNKRHLDTANRKIIEQTFINNLRDTRVDNLSTNSQPALLANTEVPLGTIQPMASDFTQQNQQPEYNISKSTASYQLAPSSDIFSGPKNGTAVSYKIVPFDLMASS